jgi:hypothetical protein
VFPLEDLRKQPACVAATIDNATEGEANKSGEVHAHSVRGFGDSLLFVAACSELEATHGTLLRSGAIGRRLLRVQAPWGKAGLRNSGRLESGSRRKVCLEAVPFADWCLQ